MKKYTCSKIPESIVFVGDTYTIDNQQFDIHFDTLCLHAHRGEDICHVFYDFCDQFTADFIDSLDCLREDEGKLAYYTAASEAMDFAKPSRITNDSQLFRVYADGRRDSDGLVEDLKSVTDDPDINSYFTALFHSEG